jgi:cysteine-S-conjugate beta-lyase
VTDPVTDSVTDSVTDPVTDSVTDPVTDSVADSVGTPLRTLTLDQLRRRSSAKWRTYPDDVLPLFVAEMDSPQAEPVVEAVIAAMTLGDTGYSAGTGYAEAYADFAKERWGWTFEPDQSAVVPDVMLGIVEMLKLLTGPGDPVVVNSPVYTPFYEFAEDLGRRVVEAPLGEDHRIDLAVLEDTFRAVVGRGRRPAYLLCSPHNPTGTVHTERELVHAMALAEEYGVRVVVDEIHAPLVYDEQRHRPALSLPGGDRAITLLSASKAWNLAGLRSAIAVARRAPRRPRREPAAARRPAGRAAARGPVPAAAGHLSRLARLPAARSGRRPGRSP